MKQKVFVIGNPKAGGGVARLFWPQACEELKNKLGPFDFEESTSIGHSQFIAQDAANAGYELVVAYGGDGTIHEVVNGIWRARTEKKPTLGIVCVGTGADLIKTLNIPKNISEQIKIIAGSKTRCLDLGQVEYTNRDGKKEKRVFINITSAGLGAEVVRRVGRSRAIFGRKLAYLTSTLESYVHWKPKKISIQTENKKTGELNFPEKPLIVVLANGRFFGGGMPIAPSADPTDGYFDFVIVGQFPSWKIPVVLSLLYFKQFHRLENVFHDRVRTVTLTSEESVDLDIDGEPVGTLPATFQVLPRSLNVKAP